MLKVYLAGPEVFHPDASSIGERKKDICREFGFEGLFPIDADLPSDASPEARLDERIYRGNVAMMRRADLGVFNLTPFRGVSADVGTAFELGFFVGMAKAAFGYSEDPREMLERVRASTTVRCVDGRWVDADGMHVEDFGNGDNLMIACALRGVGGTLITNDAITPLSEISLENFRACVEQAARLTASSTRCPPSTMGCQSKAE